MGESGWWELPSRSREDGPDLVRRSSDGRGRRHDLGGGATARDLVDGRLVEPDHGAQRATDEVQLVLNDEVGRQIGVAGVGNPSPGSEQRPDLPLPRHHGELVHGADDERRAIGVHVAVDDVDR